MMFRIIVILIVVNWTFGQSGTDCTISHTNERGVCRRIRDCRHLVPVIKKRQPYTRCGFEGRREIVCCPTGQTPGARVPKSVQKCREYGEKVYVYQTIFVGMHKVLQKAPMCKHKVIPLVVGGTPAKESEFPHMALFGYGKQNPIRWYCGGALISENYVLTAAHCTHTQYGSVTKIRLGELDYSKPDETAHTVDFSVAQIIDHPLYRGSSHYNDIALIRLDRDVTLTPYVRPACLSTEYQGPYSRAIATGWGTTDFAGPYSTSLLKVTLDLFQYNECKSFFKPENHGGMLINGVRDAAQVCAGSKTKVQDTCQGDSGGPLQVYNETIYCTYTLIGITSFGSTCGTIGVPGVYTRVFNYLDWIENIVWP